MTWTTFWWLVLAIVGVAASAAAAFLKSFLDKVVGTTSTNVPEMT